MTDHKPYRPNVGVALFNATGRVLIGHRFRDDGPEIILPGLEWQMPQGGDYYAYLTRRHTTTDLTPQQIHDKGLSEVARIACFSPNHYWPRRHKKAKQD